MITFDAAVHRLDSATIVRLPADASAELPSRGQVAVRGTINGRAFSTVLEPDGASGHWMRMEPKLQRATAAHSGDTVAIAVEPAERWREPELPKDFAAALDAAPPSIRTMWADITPMARWEWVRWINATRNADTRRRRVEVAISKMSSGKRRPCCFDLSSCTDPELSRNGRLLGIPG